VILGDLYVTDEMVRVVLKVGRWPDRADLDAPLTTWRESREDFAAQVDAVEWAIVDSAFSNLHRTSLMVRLGEPLDENDQRALEEFQPMIPRAREVALRHATSRDERDRVVAELGRSG
jgi:hypothetical protein